MQSITISGQTFSYTHSETSALKAVDGRKSRVFPATTLNLHRLGYAIFDLAAEVQPIIKQDGNIITIERGEKICRVYWNRELFWDVQTTDKHGTWIGHPAVNLACRLYAKQEAVTMFNVDIQKTMKATPKHVFMALLGLNQGFVVVGKKADIQHGICEGILKMQSSPENN